MIPGAPSIDTYVDIHIVFRSQALVVSGSVRGDDFPNAEVFVTDAAGGSILLFEFGTTGGQSTGPIARLVGEHSSQILGTFSSRISLMRDGAFAEL